MEHPRSSLLYFSYMKSLLSYRDATIKKDWRTQYIRYRIGRLKHQYWLWNRKKRDKFLIDPYDKRILENCQSGTTVFFASCGYYLRDIFPSIISVEHHAVVKTFYPEVHVCARSDLSTLQFRADNFAVVNNRADQWYDRLELDDNMQAYTKIMNPGCRFFFSFRDTQIPKLNRLKIDLEQYWLTWAQNLEKFDLKLVWHDIQFPKKDWNDTLENPDTTNGNLKFWFVYRGTPWIPI